MNTANIIGKSMTEIDSIFFTRLGLIITNKLCSKLDSEELNLSLDVITLFFSDTLSVELPMWWNKQIFFLGLLGLHSICMADK